MSKFFSNTDANTKFSALLELSTDKRPNTKYQKLLIHDTLELMATVSLLCKLAATPS